MTSLTSDMMDIDDNENELNPFLQPPVLKILFKHMDIQSLKVARQVCHCWNEESAEELGRKSVIRIKNNQFYNEYESLSFPVRNVRLNHRSYFEHNMFENVGHSLSSVHFPLEIGPVTDDGNYQCCPLQWSTIHSILLRCRHLKEFSVSIDHCIHFQFYSPRYRLNENIFYNNSWICGEEKYANITTLKISLMNHASLASLFIKRMPCISSIEISVGGQIYLDTILDELTNLRQQKYLQSLSKVKIQGNVPIHSDSSIRFGDRHLSNLISMKLTGLKSLEITDIPFRNPATNLFDEKQLSPSLFYELFSQCSKTLKFLSLNNDKANQLPILKFPLMESLIYLEIYLPLVADWPRLLLRTNILEKFPKLKKFVGTQRYIRCCSVNENFGDWNTFNLECKSISDSEISNGVHELHLKVHNFRFSAKHTFFYKEMRSFFPTLRSMRTTIKGYQTLLSLLTVMRWTFIEEIDITVLCFQLPTMYKLLGGSCNCHDEGPCTVLHDFWALRCKKDIKDFEKLVGNRQFSNLQKLSITSGGCEVMNHAVSFPDPWLWNFLTEAKNLKILQLNGNKK